MLSKKTIGKVLVGQPSLIKELDLEELLDFYPLFDAQQLQYTTAQKIKPMKVKPISTILVDSKVLHKFLLDTLEAREGVKANGYVCWGGSDDVWMQTEEKLHAKYILGHIDPDGWTHCDPKPEFPVNGMQVTLATMKEIFGNEFEFGIAGGWCVINDTNKQGETGWGDERFIPADIDVEKHPEYVRPLLDKYRGKTVYIQCGQGNDWVIQQPSDDIDTYVVKMKVYNVTYSHDPNEIAAWQETQAPSPAPVPA